MSSNGASGSSQGGSKGGKKSDRDLDLENSHRGVWLVKVPKYISDRWEKAAANTEVRLYPLFIEALLEERSNISNKYIEDYRRWIYGGHVLIQVVHLRLSFLGCPISGCPGQDCALVLYAAAARESLNLGPGSLRHHRQRKPTGLAAFVYLFTSRRYRNNSETFTCINLKREYAWKM